MLTTTHSRTGFVCLMFIIIASFFFAQKKGNILRKILVLLLMISFIFVVLHFGLKNNVEFVNRIFQRATDSQYSTGLKRDTWEIGFELIKQRPIIGWGNNSVYYNTFINSSSRWGWGVHNSYLVMLVEGGIIGFSFYFLFFFFMIKEMIDNYNVSKNKGFDRKEIIFIRGTIVLCVTLAINGLSESFLFSAGNLEALPFWFSFLFLYGFLKLKRLESNK
jgi:O-antigen ligase